MSYIRPLQLACYVLIPVLGFSNGCSEKPEEAYGDPPETVQTGSESGPHATGQPDALPDYLVNPPADPRAALASALEEGLLDVDAPSNEKLRSVLRVAGVAEQSQVLVFTKTSLQAALITPTHPRAIYFNDDCYIGYVPGGIIEYGDTDADPEVGSGFFALDMRQRAQARLVIDNNCIICHSGSRTNNRPGFLIRSVFPDKTGFPITSAGSTLVGHDTPINKRWGGWYVTGKSGKAVHRGNQTAVELPNGDAELDLEVGTNITDLKPYFNTKRYLQPTSDIVALMVLEHQVEMHNLLTQGASVVHEQTQRSRSLAKFLDETFDPAESETLQRVIDSHAKRIVKHMLFCEEIALETPVEGSPGFQKTFQANKKTDATGRSLKEFDLQTQMFKYRCSYMVYSRAFGLMPDLLKDAVIKKLHVVLSDDHDDEDYAHLDVNERRAIRTILSETTDWF